jgi:hypothetical protein
MTAITVTMLMGHHHLSLLLSGMENADVARRMDPSRTFVGDLPISGRDQSIGGHGSLPVVGCIHDAAGPAGRGRPCENCG